MVQRQEGWARGNTLHVLLLDRHRLSTDMRQTPAGTRSWSAEMNDYFDTPTVKHPSGNPLQIGDPFAEFRRAHDAGDLVRINTTTYRLRPEHSRLGDSTTVTYELDARTALPTRAVLTWTRRRGPWPSKFDGSKYRTVFSYDLYERLRDTAANRAKLGLLPHPGAGPSKTDARTKFSILREGAPITATQRRFARPFAKDGLSGKPHFEVAGARRGPHDVVLIPGKGYVGVMRGGGGTIATVDVAVKRGLAFGGSAINKDHSMYVVVADDVRAVRARLPHHAWRTFPVEQNVAVLPNGGYQFRLVR